MVNINILNILKEKNNNKQTKEIHVSPDLCTAGQVYMYGHNCVCYSLSYNLNYFVRSVLFLNFNYSFFEKKFLQSMPPSDIQLS